MRPSSVESPHAPALADARAALAETLILLGRLGPTLDPLEAMHAKTAAYYLRQLVRALLEREKEKSR